MLDLSHLYSMSDTSTDFKSAGGLKKSMSRRLSLILNVLRQPSKKVIQRPVSQLLRFLSDLVAIVIGIAIIWCLTISVLIANKSVDLSFLGDNFEIWFAQSFQGKQSEVGQIKLSWHPFEEDIRLRISDAQIYDQAEKQSHSIGSIIADFDFSSFIVGDVKPQLISLSGGAMTWSRNSSGDMRFDLGTPDSLGNFATVGFDSSVRGPTSNARLAMGSLQKLIISDADIYIRDDINSIELDLSSVAASLDTRDGKFEVNGSADLIQDHGLAPLNLDLSMSDNLEDFSLVAKAQKLSPSDLKINVDTLNFLQSIDILVDLDLVVTALPDIGLSELYFELKSGPGQVQIGPYISALNETNIAAAYNKQSEELNISNFFVRGEDHSIQAKGVFTNIGSPVDGFLKENVSYDIAMDSAFLNLSPVFAEPFSFNDSEFKGVWRGWSDELSVDHIKIGIDDYVITGQQNLVFGEETKVIGIRGGGRIDGFFDYNSLLNLWPVNFAKGARDWIDRAIEAGRLTDLKFDVDIDESGLSGNRLNNDDLKLTFNVVDGTARYIPTMTPYTNVSGAGVLYGNSLVLNTTGGNVGPVNVKKGQVDIPKLSPKGGDIMINVTGEGQVTDMLELIDQEPFKFTSLYGIEASDLAGNGEINMTITRPLLVNFEPGRITYDVSGDFENVSMPVSVGGLDLTNGDVSLKANKSSMIIDGPVSLGPWNTHLNIIDNFEISETPTQFKMTGLVDRDTLDGAGIGLRKYFDGVIDLTITGEAQNTQISKASLAADLSQTEIILGDYWSKPASVSASVSADIAQNDKQGFSLDDLSFQAPGLALVGDLSFQSDMRLNFMDFNKIHIDGLIDTALTVMPNSTRDRFDVEMSGNYLDISPFISKTLSTQASNLDIPVNLKANLARLALNPAYFVNDVDVEFQHSGTAIENVQMEGSTSDGQVSVSVAPRPSDDRRIIEVDIPDASNAAIAFFGIDNLKGGQVRFSGEMVPAGEQGPLTGELNVDEFVLVRAPVLAQLLSLASLEGLANLFGGFGLSFDGLNVPFSFESGFFSVRDARASGPALGITGSGDINFSEKLVDFNGVLVPAYAVNSILGEIPGLGELVGKEGEGVFALNYSVLGPFEKTTVAVNPFSALTPGFLRRIFDIERDDIGDDQANETQENIAEPIPVE